jgi:hypothetical protein
MGTPLQELRRYPEMGDRVPEFSTVSGWSLDNHWDDHWLTA